jgi:hypothetical protein
LLRVVVGVGGCRTESKGSWCDNTHGGTQRRIDDQLPSVHQNRPHHERHR